MVHAGIIVVVIVAITIVWQYLHPYEIDSVQGEETTKNIMQIGTRD
jgi:hypothetical protein